MLSFMLCSVDFDEEDRIFEVPGDTPNEIAIFVSGNLNVTTYVPPIPDLRSKKTKFSGLIFKTFKIIINGHIFLHCTRI